MLDACKIVANGLSALIAALGALPAWPVAAWRSAGPLQRHDLGRQYRQRVAATLDTPAAGFGWRAAAVGGASEGTVAMPAGQTQ